MEPRGFFSVRGRRRLHVGDVKKRCDSEVQQRKLPDYPINKSVEAYVNMNDIVQRWRTISTISKQLVTEVKEFESTVIPTYNPTAPKLNALRAF
jgi:hypothetical protein